MPPHPSRNPSSSTSNTLHDIEKAPRIPSSSSSTNAAGSDFQPTIADEFDAVHLPYRTLSEQARMGEYLTETPSGLQRVRSTATGRKVGEEEEDGGKEREYELVTFVEGDRENPKNWSKAMKWWCTANVALTCFAVAFNSAVITADLAGVSATFGVSEEVSLLPITVFVIGFGVGPMAFAPLSEICGRRPIYARPLVGGFAGDALGWRWLYWLQLILSGFCYVLITFTVPETYAPTILARRAKKLRKQTGDCKYVTEMDLDKRPLGERLRVFLVRPFQLLFMEPIVLFISIYMSVLYSLLYMFFIAYPVVYQEGKGWTASSTGLMFIPLAVGVVMSAMCSPFVNRHYLQMVAKHDGKPPAEARLVPMMWSCWFIPVGLFTYAWTSYPTIHWAGPCFAGWPVGFGFIFLYNSANNYLVDSYQHQAASALAAKTFLRSFCGAGSVLFTLQMYRTLNYQWASTLLGFIALACCAIPYVFYYKGAAIRKRSHYAFTGDSKEEK
ncbi:MFS general substrate transporter [Hortaea werneckii]|nr:MFS general substrate transporter [Hortaea werneckii]